MHSIQKYHLAIPLLGLALTIGTIACASGGVEPESPPPLAASTRVDGELYPSGQSGGHSTVLRETAPNPDYGSSEAPVPVGGLPGSSGPGKELLFLNSLLGPQGQTIHFKRVGSCCKFETENSELGGGLLDVYEITYEGLDEPRTLYLNMYDPGPVYIPQGFTAAAQ